MREEYEQMELDTRRQLDKAIAQLTEDTVKTAGEMITACGEAPTAVRNRHEAFGIAAERLAKIKKAVKAIDGDTSILLGTLPDANYPAIEAVSSICNSTLEAAATMIEAAAEMRRTLRDLYEAENTAQTDSPSGVATSLPVVRAKRASPIPGWQPLPFILQWQVGGSRFVELCLYARSAS